MDFVMPVRQVGSLDVSLVGLGCNNFGGRTDEDQSVRVIEAAVDAGINFFDTADVYGGTRSEEIVGRALSGVRDEVVIATKFGAELAPDRKGAAPRYVKQALEDSLRRLGTDHVDLYQLHRPDPQVPVADTLGALADLVDEGKVREIGCSNFTVEQLREARSVLRQGAPGFASVQNEYSLLERAPELGVLDECERQGIAFIPFYPLKAGLLSGKYRSDQAPPAGSRLAGMPEDRRRELLAEGNFRAVAALEAWARSHGHSLLDVAIAWLAAQRAVASVIAGATRPEQVLANARAADWVLTEDEAAEVAALVPAPS